ncbi:hypothetical protein [uncultured Prevotella sp.]|uniref:hypothetical protein n=1 Tax=uncultured Prevotella sp. TaxID=159272 RepID=UPI00280640C4|nr:hypothetical protein [uncultured Prevotella sp.]
MTLRVQQAKGKFIGGLIGFGMGVVGAAINMLIDSKFKEEEYNMTKSTVSNIERIHLLDKEKSKIVSDGK